MRKIIALLLITLLPTLLAAQTKSTIQPRQQFVRAFASTVSAAAAPKPSAVCTSQLTPLTLEVGQGIPLPRSFSNPTSSSVTFSIAMLANSIFGPAHGVGRVTLASRTGQTSSSPTIHPTGLRTPVGFARVQIIVTTNRTGSEVVGRCDYNLTMKAPPGVPGKIPRPIAAVQSLNFMFQVPVRMCVLEGSALAAGKKPGETIAGKELLDLLESVNKDIWFPNAQIAFSSAIETGFPVVADPTPPGGQTCGVLGDLNAAGFANGDGPFAETACATAWQQRYPNKVGIPIIFARDFCDSGAIKGGAAGPDDKLYVKSRKAFSGQRGDDLCGVPRRLTGADITNQIRKPFVIIVDPSRDPAVRNHLAHELGHNLFLGHGNGLDDNRDGTSAGRPGPRRYDEYCDPGWFIPPADTQLAEEASVRFISCEQSSSLMNESASCSNLQPLQVETARDVARLMPGFINTTPVPVFTVWNPHEFWFLATAWSNNSFSPTP